MLVDGVLGVLLVVEELGVLEDAALVAPAAVHFVRVPRPLALENVLGDDMVNLVHHLLVLLQEVRVHAVVVLDVNFVLPVIDAVDVFVCLPVFFIKLGNRWVEHHEWHVVVFLWVPLHRSAMSLWSLVVIRVLSHLEDRNRAGVVLLWLLLVIIDALRWNFSELLD